MFLCKNKKSFPSFQITSPNLAKTSKSNKTPKHSKLSAEVYEILKNLRGVFSFLVLVFCFWVFARLGKVFKHDGHGFCFCKETSWFGRHILQHHYVSLQKQPKPRFGLFPQGNVMVLKNMLPKPLHFIAKNKNLSIIYKNLSKPCKNLTKPQNIKRSAEVFEIKTRSAVAS